MKRLLLGVLGVLLSVSVLAKHMTTYIAPGETKTVFYISRIQPIGCSFMSSNAEAIPFYIYGKVDLDFIGTDCHYCHKRNTFGSYNTNTTANLYFVIDNGSWIKVENRATPSSTHKYILQVNCN